jgi:hypothetical protein
MCFSSVPNGANLFRHVFHPVSFSGARATRFAQNKFLKLNDYFGADGMQCGVIASVAWDRYLPTENHVHEYGCRLARKRNRGIEAAGKTKASRNTYCGAYTFTAAALRALTGAVNLDEVISADVIHHVEAGEIAHTDLIILFQQRDDFDVDGTKTAISALLWAICAGPWRHSCEEDRGVANHPSAGLSEGPLGAFRDTRGRLLRCWWIARFRLCDWVYRHRRPDLFASSE